MTRSFTLPTTSLLLIFACSGESARAGPPERSAPVSMPERLVEGRALVGKIVMLEMSQFPRESWPAVERRVDQELRSMGLQTERVSSVARDLRARVTELREHAAARQAVGSLRIVRQGNHQRVEIWLHDALTGKTVFRKVEVKKKRASEPNAVSLVALNAVEVLRASLIEVRMRESLRRRAPEVVEQIIERELDENAQPEWGRAWLSPAIAADVGDSSVSVLSSMQIGAAVRALRWLDCGLELELPLLPATIQESRGSADIRLIRVAGLVAVEPWPEARWSPSVNVSGGIMVLNASGEGVASSYEASSQWATVPWLGLRVSLAVRIATRLRVVGALSVGSALPGVEIRFEDDVVATVAQPLLGGQLGIEWRWTSL